MTACRPTTKPALAMSEVDDSGQVLLELQFDAGDHTYRVLKVPIAALELDVMRRTAGIP